MKESNIQILLAEDEPKLGGSIQNELQENGFEVSLVTDGAAAVEVFRSRKFDLALLDIKLPNVDGKELCKIIRQENPNIPIIMLTALGEVEDKLESFSAGADDYIVKPFHLGELLARIRVFIKRHQVAKSADGAILRVADLEIDPSNKSVVRGGKSILLTVREFDLLCLLARAEGHFVSKQEITEKVWRIDFETGTNTIEVYINFLRNKIDKHFHPKLIHTKPGFGYFLKDLS